MSEANANETQLHDTPDATRRATTDAQSLDIPDVQHFDTTDARSRDAANAPARRALVVADAGEVADSLTEKLASVGFEVARAGAEEALRRATEVVPSVVLLAFGEREGEGRLVTLARRLRAEALTFALPVVFLFRSDERTLRSAAAHVGADDYFAQASTPEELRARLDALLWRAEAGRRSAPVVAEQRDEIDNFIFLLDAASADARRGTTGTLALIEARGNSLAAAHGFLKLNLRRVDAVAFYGPATLLIYLPGARSEAARRALDVLRDEFLKTDGGGDLVAGLSSFPAHGAEVEGLVERAEAALERARASNTDGRVFVYGTEDTDAQAAATDDVRTKLTDGVRTKPAAAPVEVASTNATDKVGARAASDTDEASGALAAVSEARSGDGAQTTSRLSIESASRAGVEASQRAERRASGRMRRLMLVVSDAARMAQVNLLLRSAGYEVRAAFDAQHALNLLRIDSPDLLVVDYELGGMDGVEMLKRLAKQAGANAPTPALMLVPAGREELRREAREAGARAVVQMPYDPVELLERLSDIVETE